MRLKKQLFVVFISVLLFFSVQVAFGYPVIQIHSPQNTTYNNNEPIVINVTSTEPVEFYRLAKNGMHITLAKDTTSYISSIYGTRGNFPFIIYANNSNGTVHESLNYSINHSSTVNITDCGDLFGSNVTFVIQNNLSSTASCINSYATSYTLDMQGYTVEGNPALYTECFDGDIINGDLHTFDGDEDVIVTGTKCKFRNLHVHMGQRALFLSFFTFGLFENITITDTSTGFSILDDSGDIVFRNLTINTTSGGTAFDDRTPYSTFHLENSSINADTAFSFDTTDTTWYLKNNGLNISSVNPDSTILSRVRFFKMHLLNINVTDTNGDGIASSVEILDNGALPRVSDPDQLYTLTSNPTSALLIGTDENGIAQTYIAERLILYKVQSPLSSDEIEFGPYEFTARSAHDINVTGNINVNLNSTLNTNFTITLPSGSLDSCTISQMLDLNNDGNVNIQDATIVLRRVVGLPLNITGTKDCNGINLLAG